jgi:hypothetical protein
MSSVRKSGVAVLALFLTLWLAACQHSGDNATEAATGEPGNTTGTSSEADGNSYAGTRSRQAKSITIPAGTLLEVSLIDNLSSARNHSGETFAASLEEPIVVNGVVAVPKGANVTGAIVAAVPSGHLKTPAELAVKLSAIEVGRKSYEISTSGYARRGESHKKHDAKWIGGMAGGGALLGALVGHGKGAAIGAGVGAGAGTATAYATGKKDIILPSESRLRFRLKEPLTIPRAG